MTSSVYPDPDEARRRADEKAAAALARLLDSYRSDSTLGPYLERKVEAFMDTLAACGTIIYDNDREHVRTAVATLVAEVIRDMTVHQFHS